MQYGVIMGAILARYLRKPAERRTVLINEVKRQMQYRHERGQSEPAGTCEKQGYRSFSLSIRCEGEVSESVPDSMPILHWSEYLP